MKKRTVTKLYTICALVLLLFIAVPLSARAQSPQAVQYDQFRKRSQLLIDQQNDSMTVDSSKRVRLDRSKLAKRKVPAADVEFLQQLTDFSNDVVEASKTSQGINGATTKLTKYPKVQEYFKQATDFTQSGQTLSLKKNGYSSPLTNFALVGNPISEAAGMADCGIYWSPKPNVAKSWVTVRVNNAEAVLRSWGYHDSYIPRAGWTRPQTWHPWNCGWNTFRDNAVPIDFYTLREQNYAGWSPRGEPNPEVYASGPWPYGGWPAYVYWWHQTRN